jgi:hypothetical protein
MIQTLDQYPAGSWNHCGESRQAQAPFEEGQRWRR